MAKCSHLVGRGVIAQQCELDASHEGPHVSASNPVSVEARKQWSVDNDPKTAANVLREFHDPPQTFGDLRGELKDGKPDNRVHPSERDRLAREAAAQVEATGGGDPTEFAVVDEVIEEVPEVEVESLPVTEEPRPPFPGTLGQHVEEETVAPHQIAPQSARAMIVEGTTLLLEGIDQCIGVASMAAHNMRLARPMLQLSTPVSDEDAAALAKVIDMLGRTADVLDGGQAS